MENQNEQTPQAPPQEQDLKVELTPTEEAAIIQFGGVIDLENVPKNAVLTVKLSTADHLYANNLQMGIIERVLKPRMELLKEKKLTVLFMAADDDISLLSEEDMGRAGWVKKEPSLIIKPWQKVDFLV